MNPEVVVAIGKLTIEIWDVDFNHAVSGHPEVTREKIRAALQNPFKIVQSKSSDNVCLFFSFEIIDKLTGEITYFCVVIATTTPGTGKLVTAYETTYIKAGKVLLERKETK